MLEELKTRAIALATTRTGRAGGARGASAAEDLELAAALGSYFDQAESIVSRQIAQLDACVRSVYGRRDPSQRATYEDNFERLSTTERRILVELAKGKPNKILAYEFSVREATIKAHVSNILKKLNASNRGHAIALVARCR
jgi:DNA-binding NarL/FixJ family response regulator